MRAVTVLSEGPHSTLAVADVPIPHIAPHEVLIRVHAAGVNRADLGQRAGEYPPPAGASALLGMEVSGTVEAAGADAQTRLDERGITVGSEVCALLAGGGYAEYAAADARLVLPVPAGVDVIDAAALPETVATVWSNLVMVARLTDGDTILVHGGGSGIGTMAIQVAAALGARVAVTAGTRSKLVACARLGAEILIDYTRSDFVEVVRSATNDDGADVILDHIGGDYLARDLRALAQNGRIVFIGNQSGDAADLPIGLMMQKRASVYGTTLRSRPLEEKADIIAQVYEHLWPLISAKRIRPIVDSRYTFAEANEAHVRMRASTHIGKILLTP